MKIEPFIRPFQSLVLGTMGQEGYPFNSYAPFVYDTNRLYIVISDIATHARNLQHFPKASALFIEDESVTTNIFARKRLSLQCDVHKLDRNTEVFSKITNGFKEKFDPSMVNVLMQMPDFNVYMLTPIGGEATFGFGEAYVVGGENMDELLHRTKKMR